MFPVVLRDQLRPPDANSTSPAIQSKRITRAPHPNRIGLSAPSHLVLKLALIFRMGNRPEAALPTQLLSRGQGPLCSLALIRRSGL